MVVCPSKRCNTGGSSWAIVSDQDTNDNGVVILVAMTTTDSVTNELRATLNKYAPSAKREGCNRRLFVVRFFFKYDTISRAMPAAKKSKPKKISSIVSNDPLHGTTLKMIIEHLVQWYGWRELERRISINCFKTDPSVKSSLVFLRRTPWAREKVEALYLHTIGRDRPKKPFTPLDLG
jgi:hypothetical protein